MHFRNLTDAVKNYGVILSISIHFNVASENWCKVNFRMEKMKITTGVLKKMLPLTRSIVC